MKVANYPRFLPCVRLNFVEIWQIAGGLRLEPSVLVDSEKRSPILAEIMISDPIFRSFCDL